MSFLAPFFLLGGVAIALPVVFHLIRRTTRERTRFSSLMFLQPTPPRLTRKSRLEDLLLLLLRCLALGLLAFGFARPFLKQPAPPTPADRAGIPTVLLLDTSASMRREGVWSAARQRAEALAREARPEDPVALFTYDREVVPRVTFEAWASAAPGARSALIEQALGDVSPGWSSTQLGAALIRAAEVLVELDAGQTSERGRIVVVSDLQEGSRLETLQAYEWPKGIEVVLSPVKATRPGNASLQVVGDSPGMAAVGGDSLRVRVSNATDSTGERFQVGWEQEGGAGFLGTPIEVYVPPGQNRMVAVPFPGTNAAPDRLVLRGDAEPFDNTVSLAPPEVVRVEVPYLGSETAADSRQPLYFLQRALPSTPRLSLTVTPRPPLADPPPGSWTGTPLIVATEPVGASAARALRSAVESGSTLLAAPKSAAALASLAPVFGLESLAVSEGAPASYAMLAEVDLRHPLFAAFADARFNDFTRLHFWKYRRWDPAALSGARVLARFDRGDPAVVEVPMGKGRVVVLASGWNPDDSQWALSTKFVPWIFSLLELAGGIPAIATGFTVGDEIPAEAWGSGLAGAVKLSSPGGGELALAERPERFAATATPGLYVLQSGAVTRRLAVNLDASEGRTAPLAADELERWGVPGAATTLSAVNRSADPGSPADPRMDSAMAEGRQKLWRWFLVATLGVLLVESALSGWLTRRSVASPA
ncbi:MAG: BatA domain-containing protein [Verrucomicrobia bacterium]|nr:BatA domain-containing protein [Verrucomicrobiota bacterium]